MGTECVALFDSPSVRTRYCKASVTSTFLQAFIQGVYTYWVRGTTLILRCEVASLQKLQSALFSPKLYSFCGKSYLEHHDLQHQPGPLLPTAVRGSDPLHAAVGIRTRAAGMARAVCASAVERFQAVGQRDADHGGW